MPTTTPTITRLATRRGRPKSSPRPEMDLGTPELIFKRAHGDTSEAIDLCLERGIISQVQHRAGLHLRWLYTLRYGAPGISAMDLTRINGSTLAQEMEASFRSAREAEFDEAVAALGNARAYAVVMAVCIYDERPKPSQHHALQQGLTELVTLRKAKGAQS